MRRRIGLAATIGLGSCVSAPRAPAPLPAPAARPAPMPMQSPPQPFRPVPRPTPTFSGAPERLDWRDIPLTPGRWTWQSGAGRGSLSQYGEPGQPAALALRCDGSRGTIIFAVSARGGLGGGPASMTVTTSFGSFAVPARDGDAGAPAIVAELAARDPRLDQLAFSRGRFLIDIPGQPRLVVPSWPEAARVIEDCRS